MNLKKSFYVIFSAILYLFAQNLAFADPPYITDSPVPPDYHHWDIYLYSILNKSNGSTNIQVPALELDWGAAKNCELELFIPSVMNSTHSGSSAYGLGDLQTGFIYRFVTETSKSPQVGIEPLMTIPSGNANKGLGNGNIAAQMPLWVEKNWKKWRVYGGGGYFFNAEPGNLDYPFAGGVIQRNITQELALGMELYSQGRTSTTTHAYTLLNFGETYQLNKKLSLLGRVGNTIIGEEHLVSYVGILYQP